MVVDQYLNDNRYAARFDGYQAVDKRTRVRISLNGPGLGSRKGVDTRHVKWVNSRVAPDVSTFGLFIVSPIILRCPSARSAPVIILSPTIPTFFIL